MLKATSSIISASQIATPITLAGNVTLSTGNLIPSTAGKGIDFTANTPFAGMTSQLLNRYEEGTFTPTAGTLTVVGTFSSGGTYVRNGRQVTIQGFLAATTSISGIGGQSVYFESVPFTPAINGGNLGTGVNAAKTIILAFEAYTNNRIFLTIALSATTRFDFSLTYICA